MRTITTYFEDNKWAGDAIIAGIALVVLGMASIGTGDLAEAQVSMTVLLVLPLFWRRTFPLAVLVATVGLCFVQLVFLAQPVPGDLVIPLVIHAAAAYIPDRRWGLGALGAGIVGSALATVRWTAGSYPGFVGGSYRTADAGSMLFLFCAGAAGVAVAYLIGIRHRDKGDRAAEKLAALAERNRLLTAEQLSRSDAAAAAERARIARELHDIVAHSLSVIVVQADGGIAASTTSPETAPQVLDTIAETSRDALAQMRRMVSVLRAGSHADSGNTENYAPTPGPDNLDELVAQVTGTGLPVTMDTIGTPRPMAEDAGLAVYRMVQESLTNVLKHAGPAASVTIVVHYGASEVLVTVTDDGRGAASDYAAAAHDADAPDREVHGAGQPDGLRSAGHGLRGMRERVELIGGSVQAGPCSGGGFEVSATVPYTARHIAGTAE